MNKITVGLVTYNRPFLLKRAVKSVLNQEFKNFKLLIGNDFIKKKISFKSLGIKKDKRITIFNHKKNLGERNNKNFLLQKSKSEWFIWLADDDYFHKDFFKIMLKNINLNKKKKIVAFYSNYSRKKLQINQKKCKPKIFNKLEFLEGFISQKIRLIGVYGLIRTKQLKRIKGIHATGKSFSINNKKAHIYPYCDYLVPILLSKFGDISWIENRLVHLNTDISSLSSYTKEYSAYISAEKYILNKLKITINDNNYLIRKNKIFLNLFNRFAFNRLIIIKKINPIINLLYFFKYYADKVDFRNEARKYNVECLNFNFLSIIKSIIYSFRNILDFK